MRYLGLVLVVLLMAMALSGCMASAAEWPDRAVDVNIDSAMAGQEAGMAGLMMGNATMDESQFSSFLTYLLQQNSGPNMPIESITAWFEPDNQIFLEVSAPGVINGADTVRLAGTIDVVDNAVQLDLATVGIGPVLVEGPLVDYVESVINNALADPQLGVAVDVATDTGSITLGMGQ
jgi:hypothetical protein